MPAQVFHRLPVQVPSAVGVAALCRQPGENPLLLSEDLLAVGHALQAPQHDIEGLDELAVRHRAALLRCAIAPGAEAIPRLCDFPGGEVAVHAEREFICCPGPAPGETYAIVIVFR